MTPIANPNKPLLVFIHGWSCRASDWDATLAALRPQLGDHCQLLALDLPGHGGNEHQPWHDWTISGLAHALIDQLPNSQSITLIGHSMGGCVALEAATQLRARAQRVILVDTFGLPYGDMDAATISSIEEPFRADFVAAMHYLVDNTTAQNIASDTRDWIKTRMASGNPDKLIPIWHNLLHWSPDAVFAQVRCPIYAINGEHIPQVAQQRCSPYVQAQVLPGCHHFPQFEQPQHFQQVLQALLNDVQARL